LSHSDDPAPDSELSDFEKSLLEGVDTQFKEFDYSDMINFVHGNCPEWKYPYGSSIAINMTDIFKGMNKSQEEIEFLLQEQKSFDEEDRNIRALASA
jgi:hypothetical protein